MLNRLLKFSLIFLFLGGFLLTSCGKKNKLEHVQKSTPSVKPSDKVANIDQKIESDPSQIDTSLGNNLLSSKIPDNTTNQKRQSSSEKIEIALAIPSNHAELNPIRRDIIDGSLLALNKIKTNKISIKPFSGKYLSSKPPFMMIGPWGRVNAKEIVFDKSEKYINFALTNDISVATSDNIVTGLTPEQEAFFILDYLPKFKKQDRVLLPSILDKLGYSNRILNSLQLFEVEKIGRFFRYPNLSMLDLELGLDLSLQDENQYQLYEQELLPIVVIGKRSSSSFEKFVKSLQLKANSYRNSKTTQYFNYEAYLESGKVVVMSEDKKFPNIIPLALEDYRSTWNIAISNILNYRRRLAMYNNQLKFITNKKVLLEVKKYEVLRPPPIAAIIITLNEPSDVTWLTSLIDYYNNSYQKVPIFGMESWQESKSILKESSLNNSYILSHREVTKQTLQLDQIFYNSFKRYPSHFAKLSYDLVLLANSLNDLGRFNYERLLKVGKFSGWSGSYTLNPKGLLIHDLVLRKIYNSKAISINFENLKNN